MLVAYQQGAGHEIQIEILRPCYAGGEARSVGDVVTINRQDAMSLVGAEFARRHDPQAAITAHQDNVTNEINPDAQQKKKITSK